jgi:cell division septal protein FtsQ
MAFVKEVAFLDFTQKSFKKKLEEKLYHVRSVEIEKKLPSNVVVKISHRTP